MQDQKGNIVLIIVGIVAIAILTGGVGYFVYQKTTPKGCTKELKICSDGTGVGRTGPNCEFASCPEIIDETADWKTYRNEKYGFEVKYPINWYAHIKGESALLLLKSEKLPDIEGTEGAAYGEQIIVSATGLEGKTKEEFIQMLFPEEISREFNITKEWVKLNNMDMLRVEALEAGSYGQSLKYYHFYNGKMYNFYLYPLDESKLAQNYKDFQSIISTFKFTK